MVKKVSLYSGHQETRYPDFLVVGAARSGTSSLHTYLNQHPEIFVPQGKKELWFWHQNRNQNQAIYNYWDRSRIPQNINEYLECFNDALPDQLTGEVCPSYLYYHKETIESLKEFHPRWREVKIILILRNPVDRILSEYRYVKQNALDPENLNLEAALLKEEERKSNPQLLADLHYRSISSYYHQVEAYLSNFHNVHVCLLDDLLNDSREMLQDLYGFLDVDPLFQTDTKKIFHASKPVQIQRNSLSDFLYQSLQTVSSTFPEGVRKPVARVVSKILYREEEIPDELIRLLRIEFLGEIEMLEKLIQRDLSTWKVTENEPAVLRK